MSAVYYSPQIFTVPGNFHIFQNLPNRLVNEVGKCEFLGRPRGGAGTFGKVQGAVGIEKGPWSLMSRILQGKFQKLLYEP